MTAYQKLLREKPTNMDRNPSCKSPLHCGKIERCVMRYSALCLFHRVGIYRDEEVRRKVGHSLGLGNNFTYDDVEELARKKCPHDFQSSVKEAV